MLQDNNDLDPNDMEEEEDEDRRLERIEKEWNPLQLNSSIKGDMDNLLKAIQKGANINFEERKNKWNSILWAACKGFIDIMRVQLANGAGSQYIRTSKSNPGNTENSLARLNSKVVNTGEELKPKVQLGVINLNASNSPLQWSTQKGHYYITWLLQKEGLDWKECDSFGNTCAHQAAASNSLKTLEALLEWGISINYKNTRGHYVLDLTTEEEMIVLLKQYARTEEDEISKVNFTTDCIKYLCHFCRKYFHKSSCSFDYMYENVEDESKDRPETRCLNCNKLVEDTEKNLEETIKTQDQKSLENCIDALDKLPIKIDIKLLHRALKEKEKLRTQNKILNYIDNLKEVPNYKTILKSISVTQSMLEDADAQDIKIEAFVKTKALSEIDRLQAERNLRFYIDNIDMTECRRKDVDDITEAIKKAQAEGVSNTYVEDGTLIKNKLGRNLKAQDIYKDFLEYPPRDFPPSPIWDKKAKRFNDALTGNFF